MAAALTPQNEFDTNLALIRSSLPGISDREAMSLARLDAPCMAASLADLVKYARQRPIVFKRDMARCQAKTDANPSLLEGYRPT